MIKLLHAADLHMDASFEGVSPEAAAARRKEQRELFRRMLRRAKEEGCRLALLSGDLVDSGRSYAETEDVLISALGEFGLPVFIAPGNHDFYRLGSVYASGKLPDNVHVFTSEKMRCIYLPEVNARVWGAAFTDSVNGGLLRGFSYEKLPGVTDIMCIHGDAENRKSPNGPVSEREIAVSGMDYIAFGHIHKYSGLRRTGGVFYAWPGCPEGRGFDETGEKGVIIADVEPGNVNVRFLPMGGRRYESINVDVSEGDPVSAVMAALPENAARDAYRITLTGAVSSPVDTEAVAAALRGRVHFLRLRDETVEKRDIWFSCGEDSLRGAFLSRLRRMYDEAKTDEEREKLMEAARWGLAALDNGEEVCAL